MAKALKLVAVVAAVAAVAVVTGGAALGLGLSLGTTALGVSAGTLLTASALLSAGASLLSPKPKAPSTSSSTVDRLNADIVVRTPRKILFGTSAGGTDIRDQEWSNNQTYLHRFIVVASHKVAAIREIWLDDKLAWTSGGGAQGEFKQWLQVTPVLEGSPANAINIGPRMGASRRFTGCAYVYMRFQVLANSKKVDSVFAQSVPTRMTIVCDGALTYDPRLDSTVPGGSGPMRADDQSTWLWNASASRNPAIAMLFYLLGWRINGKLAVGKGVPAARIDLASFITAANLCDEPVARSAGGTEPRYRCDGMFSEGDDPSMVLDNLKAAMNAVLDDADGRLRLSVLHNDLAAPLGELVTDDVLGAFTWQQTLPLSDSVNIIRGGYTDPSSASLFQLIDYPEVRVDSPDGIDRSQTVNLPLVQSASQAQRLAKQRLQRMLYAGTFTAVFQSTAWKYQKGDVVRFTFGPLGWYQKLFRIADMAIQVDGKVPMMLREEHPDLYAWDASDAAPVVGAEPTSYDPTLWPIIAGLADVDQRLALVFSDNVITAGKEKRDLVREWGSLEAQFLSLDEKFEALGSPDDLTSLRQQAYDGYRDLAYTLSILQPAWDDVTRDTPVNGAALNQLWISTRQKIEAFAAAISGRPGADGASAFALINVGNCTFPTPSSIAKVPGSGNDWVGKARTAEFTTGAATVSGKMLIDTFIGLTTDPAADTSYGSIDYGLHLSSDRNIFSVWRNGTPVWESQPQGWSAPAGARGLITSDGKTVRYSIEGFGEIYSHPVNATAEPLYGAFALFRDAGEQITGITFSTGGRNGIDGLPGEDGEDGKTWYPYFAYANSPDGLIDFTTGEAGGRTYVGTASGTSATEPQIPGLYTWSRYVGPPFGMDTRGFASVAGNTIRKALNAPDAWGDADAYSTTGYTGGAIATARTDIGNATMMFGLNSDPRTDSSYSSLDYAWYLRSDNRACIYESGQSAPTPGIETVFVDGYGAGKFDVRYTGRFVEYVYNDTVYRRVDAGRNRTFYFDCALASPGATLYDVNFASYASSLPDIKLQAAFNTQRYDTNNAPVNVDMTFQATRFNSPTDPFFSVIGSDGSTQLGWGTAAQHVANYPQLFSSNGPDNFVMKGSGSWSAAVCNAMIDRGAAPSYTVQAATSLSDGVVATTSVTKVRDGEKGADSTVPGPAALNLTASVSSLTFLADYDGTLKSGQLAQVIVLTYTEGPNNVSTSVDWTVPEFSGCSGQMTSSGLVTFNSVTASGYFRVSGTYKGRTYTIKVPIVLAKDTPPANSDQHASAYVGKTVNSNSYPGQPDSSLIVTVASNQVRCTYDLTYSAGGQGNVFVEAMIGFRRAGTNDGWTTFPPVQGSQARLNNNNPSEPIDEQGTVRSVHIGTVSPGRWEVGVFTRRYQGSQSAILTGRILGDSN